MAISTIIILMLINGLAFQELFAEAMGSKPAYFLGCTISGLSGCLFPFFWSGESKAALAIAGTVGMAFLLLLFIVGTLSFIAKERKV